MVNEEAKTLLDANLVVGKLSLVAGMKIADLGSGGAGRFLFPCARLIGKDGKAYAIDILKNALGMISRRARQENQPNIETVWSNLEIFGATNLPAGSLDRALLVNTLSQSTKRVEIIRETIRLLKKGGRLLIVEWKKEATPLGPDKLRRVDRELLKSGASRLGLEIEEEFTAGPYHWGIIASKQ